MWNPVRRGPHFLSTTFLRVSVVGACPIARSLPPAACSNLTAFTASACQPARWSERAHIGQAATPHLSRGELRPYHQRRVSGGLSPGDHGHERRQQSVPVGI